MDPVLDPASPAQKPGIKTSEILVTAASILTLAIPLILEKLPPNSVWVTVLGIVMIAASYVGGRSFVKASGNKAAAFVEAAKVSAENPSKVSG